MRVPVLAVSMLFCAAACDRPPAATNLSEWQASDHDRAEEEQRIASGQSTAARGDPAAQLQTLVEVTWGQCVQCHGVSGKGDGPMGPMVKAPDLSRDEFQGRATDDDIANVIKLGRGKMPKFDSLPDPALKGLVAKIRSLRGK